MESPAGNKPESEREKTCPFLLRTFVKVNGFHSLQLFEENRLPLEDEHQIYTWKDATLREVVTYLRSLPPTALSLSLRHPSARYAFRVVFPDVTSRGKMTAKDLGTVWAKDVIDISSLASNGDTNPAGPNTMEIDSSEPPPTKNGDLARTLDELRVVPGDWLLVAVHLPQKAMGMSIAGAAGAAPGPSSNGPPRGAPPVRGGSSGIGLRGAAEASGWGRGRGADPTLSTHWRGGGRGGPTAGGTGRGSYGRDTDRLRDRRPSPTGRERDRRPSPTGRDRDRERDRSRERYHPRSRSRSRSRTRSRSPPRRSKRD
ncbi:hypothetical protein M407DRAFT_221923 [Tulasnella calospora MUT 4182]|uniref:Histone deacetylase complex subunit SAP18 n=1 Tax=Tulasnella calospora MUT 4182 TaxID=1051891 RepID=A0A0C3Q7C4_9AGAM|nr:hypothetical protein M407DRAFT_221923 [Tulasnella calospora MUT 4182]